VQPRYRLRARTDRLCGMTRLSPEEIARHAFEAGFRGDNLTTAVAIALAESSGKTDAYNGDGLDDSYGLWQINMYGSLGPDRRQTYDLDNNRELLNPATNAEVARGLFERNGDTFNDWSTYTKGIYKQHLDEARKGVREFKEDRRDGGQRGGGSGGSGQGGSGGGGGLGSSGFAVDTDLLGTYVRQARGVADGMDTIGTRHLRRIREIADDSFGKIGKESGFAAALDHFAAALHRQVRGVGNNADRLADATARTQRSYRDRDEENARAIDGGRAGLDRDGGRANRNRDDNRPIYGGGED
jgi:hypothetical protein